MSSSTPHVQALTARLHILKRTTMYAGPVEPQPMRHWWLLRRGTAEALRAQGAEGWEVEIVQGAESGVEAAVPTLASGPTPNALRVICNEVFQNALEAARSVVRISVDGDTIHVFNDCSEGHVLPVVPFAGPSVDVGSEADRRELDGLRGVMQPELAFGRPQSGSKMGDAVEGAGQYGLGVKLTNVLSTNFRATVSDGQAWWSGEWVDNMHHVAHSTTASRGSRKTISVRQDGFQLEHKIPIPPCRADHAFVAVSFTPDFARLRARSQASDPLSLALVESLVWDLAALAPPSVRVIYNGATLPVRSFEQYASAWGGAIRPVFLAKEGPLRVAVLPRASHPGALAFVNGQRCDEGTHVTAIASRIAKAISEEARKKRTTADAASCVNAPFVLRNAMLVVDLRIRMPRFANQIKTQLVNPEKELKASLQSIASLPPPTTRALCRALLDLASADAAARKTRAEVLQAKKDAASATAPTIAGVGTLSSIDSDTYRHAPNASIPSKRLGCTLIIAEGLSARALVDAGLGSLSKAGRSSYGAFALGGKPFNALEGGAMRNKVLRTLCQILGLRGEYDPRSLRSDLRYGRVLVMADQDHDGHHIIGLIIAFFVGLDPAFLEKADAVSPFGSFLWRFGTPILRGVRKGHPTMRFMTLPSFESWRDANPALARQYRWKYLKGLGTSTDEDARYYFANLDRHLLRFRLGGEDGLRSVRTFFAKSESDARKELITRYDGGSSAEDVDWSSSEISVSRYLELAVTPFEMAAVRRAVPSMMDGLKVSQRKILFAMLERNIRGPTLKVAQVAAMCSEVSDYQHGEASLEKAIVRLARDHKFGQAVNLLEPEGQFGSCNQADDSAASRYIFTRLNVDVLDALTRASDDAPILRHELDEDGLRITEPQVYGFAIPGILLNGRDGIGTGWRTATPPFDPFQVIARCRELAKAWSERPSRAPPLDAIRLELSKHAPSPHAIAPELSALSEIVGNGAFAWWYSEDAMGWRARCRSMVPWFDLFLGSVSLEDEGRSFVARGVVEVGDRLPNNVVVLRVLELPPIKWTEQWLKDVRKKPFVVGAQSHYTKTVMHVDLYCKLDDLGGEAVLESEPAPSPPDLGTYGTLRAGLRLCPDATLVARAGAALEGRVMARRYPKLEAALGLVSKRSMDEMILFNFRNRLVRYRGLDEMLVEHAAVKMCMLELRLDFMVRTHAATCLKLESKLRFVRGVMDGTIELRNVPVAEVERRLAENRFPTDAALEASFPKTFAQMRVAKSGDEDPTLSFRYLLKMPMSSMTTDKLAELESEISRTREAQLALVPLLTNPLRAWVDELDAFEAALRVHFEHKAERLFGDEGRDRRHAASAGSGSGAVSRKRPRPKKNT